MTQQSHWALSFNNNLQKTTNSNRVVVEWFIHSILKIGPKRKSVFVNKVTLKDADYCFVMRYHGIDAILI